MKTDYFEPDDIPVYYRMPSHLRMPRRSGGTILFHALPDGTVTATRDGVTGTGPTEADALTDLDRRFRSDQPAIP